MKIVITGGGTGGHIYPNIALLPKLKDNFDQIVYIGESGGLEQEIAKKHGIPFHGITCTKFVRSFTFKNLSIPYKLLKSVKMAKNFLKEINPDVVFSKGGYVSLPVCIASHKLKIPLVVHESDFSFGLANKLSAKYADKILTSFPLQYDKFPNSVFTSAPIRNEVINAKPIKLFNNSLPTALVVGGSSGASSLNQQVRSEIDEITKSFNVIHLCGKDKLDKNIIASNYKQLEFSNQMGELIKGSDIVVSRGGANSLFELILLQKPSLIVPLCNKSSRGDQVENANYFAQNNLVKIFDEKTSLETQLKALYADRQKYIDNIKKSPIKDGKDNILNAILSLVNQ